MGNSVTYPIEIKSVDQTLPWVGSKEMTWHMAQNINEWAPMVSNPPVHLHVVKEADGSLNPKSSWNNHQEIQSHIQSSL